MGIATHCKRSCVVLLTIFYVACFCPSSWAIDGLGNSAHGVLHVHIPKTGGASIKTDGRLMEAQHEGIDFQSLSEVSYLAVKQLANNLLADPGSPVTSVSIVTTLRNPFTHLLSQYMHCKFFRKEGYRHRKFNDGRDPSNILDGFEDWIDFHVAALRKAGTGKDCRSRLDDQGCYNPANMQTRYFAPSKCVYDSEKRAIFEQGHRAPSAAPAHHAYGREDLLPDLTDAIRNFDSIDIPGIMELYPQTLCLMEALTPEGMPASCECGSSSEHRVDQKHAEQHKSHGLPPHSLDMVPAHIIPKMYKLVEEDVQLYLRALSDFEAKVVEVEAQTGQRLLCGNEISEARDAVLLRVLGSPSHTNVPAA